MDWDPKKALRIDRAKKHQRESKRIDYREMNDYDQDEKQTEKKRHKSDD